MATSSIWFREEGIYYKSEVTQQSAGGDPTKCVIQTEESRKEHTVMREELFPREILEPGKGVDQLTSLSFLHEAAIIDNLRERFAGYRGEKFVYTYCGQICIAVNPYAWLRELYTENVMNRYMGARLEDNAPHVYAVADAAYMAMMGKGGAGVTNQSILVSGESGAGKTESVKIMMQYLAQLGGRSDASGSYSDVAEAVIQANPLLEAFGNAKTLLNNNSSRFGKFTKILFDKNGSIAGSRVDTYLLEKSRVVRQAEGERNYHIFYQVLAASALPPKFRKSLNLTRPADFQIVNDVLVDGLSDDKEFDDMVKSMTVVGIKPDEQENIFTMVASVINLGQTDFEAGVGAGGEEKAVLVESPAAAISSELLKVGVDGLKSSLVNRTMEARGESYTLALTLLQSIDARDALCKAIYSKLFDWLVGRINVSTSPADVFKVDSTIGVLDIFGFESFEYNTLEQLLINFANEKLQQQFTWYVFKLEQEEYDQEGIKWDAIDFQDNQPVLDVLEGYGSVLAMLQEECQLQKGDDKNFRTKLETNAKRWPKVKDPETGKTQDTLFFNRLCVIIANLIQKYPGNATCHLLLLSECDMFIGNRSQQTFIVRHYAGPVEYDVIGFVEKNRDTLQKDLVSLMMSSTSGFVQTLFKEKTVAKAGRGGAEGFPRHPPPRYTQNTHTNTPTYTALRTRASRHGVVMLATLCFYSDCRVVTIT
jgi:myosin-5